MNCLFIPNTYCNSLTEHCGNNIINGSLVMCLCLYATFILCKIGLICIEILTRTTYYMFVKFL